MTKDFDEAAKWIHKGADQGSADAEDTMGLLYEEGKGVPLDKEEALKWKLKAAAKGNPFFEFNLGAQYAQRSNYVEAAKWYMRSAEQGFPHGQNNLGYCYDLGQGVPKDWPEAYKWYQLAIAQHLRRAEVNLERLLPKLSADQIAEGEKRLNAFVLKPFKATNSIDDSSGQPKN